MHRRSFLQAIAASLSLSATAAFHPARAEETFDLTIASSHPTTLAWVEMMSKFFAPEVNKRLAASGKYKINWREAYGGQLYKQNATLTSVEQGITDIGWVWTQQEAAKMPLANVATVTPFTTDQLPIILEVMNELAETQAAVQAEWDKNNMVFLGATGVDSYHLFTKSPISAYADLNGKKIGAPGALGLWLRNSGAVPVDGSLVTFYTDIQSGVSEGAVSIATGILAAKVYEVAPYVTTVNIGALCVGALAINKDTFNALPPEVQQVLKDVGKEYTRREGEEIMRRAETALVKMQEAGARQAVPVQIAALPPAERDQWIRTMPNLAAEWVKNNEAKGLPAKRILAAYMDGLRKRGVKPARDWDQE
ncbi:MAG: C4-dicarboxylate TRAP transporter substrate-binding protein [Gammaproteobacteria bacterium]